MRLISRHETPACRGMRRRFCVATYVLSPIDLIPDFIPALGYGDDLMLVSLSSLAVAQLVPPYIMAEHRATAALRYR